MTGPNPTTDPLARFREIYDALNAQRGWFQGAASLRFAAMTAMAGPGDGAGVARGIRGLADDIKAASGWFGELNSELRFIVAAMLYVAGDDASAFLTEVQRVRELFRRADLRRGGIYETIAILVMRQQLGQAPIEPARVDTFKAIYEVMKSHHWWLTGPDDFPACAILSSCVAAPAQIGAEIEAIYQTLCAQGFAAGDPMQTAANILYLARRPVDELATRYRELAEGFRSNGISMWQSDYDELAILSFLDHPAKTIVERVVDYRADIATLTPRPDRFMTFNLAASVGFYDLVRLDADLEQITDAKALLDMQAIIAAQQAAAVAAASSAVVAASASSGH